MEFGKEEARNRGLTENAGFTTHLADFKEDFLSGHSPAVEDAQEKGGATFVENTGLTEYFNDMIAAKLVKNGWDSTAPDGGFVFSNMTDTRDQLDLNQRGVGWNKMHTRSLTQLAELIEAAGIDPSLATVYAPSDGLYYVVEIHKPSPEAPHPHSSSSTLRSIGGAASTATAA